MVLEFLGDADLHDNQSFLVTMSSPAPLPGRSTGRACGRQSVLRGIRPPQRAETVPTRRIRGQYTQCGEAIMQVTSENADNGFIQRQPGDLQVGLLVLG